MVLTEAKTGDILGFSGEGALSGLINLATLALPKFGLSHVSMLATAHGQLLNFESTSTFPETEANKCVLSKKNVKGVQAHTLQHVMLRPGKVWIYRLKRNLLPIEQARLSKFLQKQIGKKYDFVGAGKSFGGIMRAMVRQNLSRNKSEDIFCSDLCGMGIDTFWPGLIEEPRDWSPNSLMRFLVSEGVYEYAERVK